MSSESQPLGAIDASHSNPTQQQRAVYSWHEARNSDAADDIFSTEWFKRTRSFLEKHSNPDSPDITLESLEKVEDLEFGVFFIEHPVAAFALWQFLQACYGLDRVVCINPLSYEDLRRADENRVKDWEYLPPFQYLNAFSSKDGKIRRKWTASMEQLKKEIECGALEGEKLVSRLYDMYTGIERLQSSMSALRDGFDDNLKGMKFKREMLNRAGNVVEERVKILSIVLKLGENNPITTSPNDNAAKGLIDTEQDSQATDVSRRGKENSPPVSSTRLRKSNRRPKKSRAASPRKVDLTTNPVQGQGQVIGNSIPAMPATLKYLLISVSAILALLLALLFYVSSRH